MPQPEAHPRVGARSKGLCNCQCCIRARETLAQQLAHLQADYKLYKHYNHQVAMDQITEQMRSLRRVRAVLNDTPEEGAREPLPEEDR